MYSKVEDFGFTPPSEHHSVSLIFASGFIGLSGPEPCSRPSMENYAVIDFAERSGFAAYSSAAIDPRLPTQKLCYISSWDTSLPKRVLNETSPSGKACRYLALLAYDFPVLRAGSEVIGALMGRDLSAKDVERRVGSDIRRACSVGNRLLGIPSRQEAKRTIIRPFSSSSEDYLPEHIRGHCAISFVLRTQAFPAHQPPQRLIRCMPQSIRKAIYKRLDDYICSGSRSAA